MSSEGIPTADGERLAASLLADPALCERAVHDRDRLLAELGVGMAEVLAAGHHLEPSDGSDAQRVRVALFHLAVASRALRG